MDSGDNGTKEEVKTTRILENRLTGVMISVILYLYSILSSLFFDVMTSVPLFKGFVLSGGVPLLVFLFNLIQKQHFDFFIHDLWHSNLYILFQILRVPCPHIPILTSTYPIEIRALLNKSFVRFLFYSIFSKYETFAFLKWIVIIKEHGLHLQRRLQDGCSS